MQQGNGSGWIPNRSTQGLRRDFHVRCSLRRNNQLEIWELCSGRECRPLLHSAKSVDFRADGLLVSTNVTPQLRADEILFGGTAPTVWLQEHLWDGSLHLHWYDDATWVVYVSYFLATYLVAGFLWFFARGLFRRFVAMVSLLAFMGFATYALFPAAPPWMASDLGALEPTTRSIGFIWNHIPIAYFNTLFDRGSGYSNQVAAVPSLHAAYTLLIALFLWRLAPRWGRVLLAAYPLAMAFALVYTAEHYVSDILVGWVYAVFAFWAVNRMADALAARRLARGNRASPQTSPRRSPAPRAASPVRAGRDPT